jgi:predicted Rdx family selenoprotein
MLDLIIRFNPAHGFEDAALALARRLFAQYDEEIDALALIPVPDEDFSLHLNGTLLCSHSLSGRAPMVADVKAALRDEQG